MKAYKMFNLFIIVALLIGLSVTWVGAVPGKISGDRAIGSSCCNWDTTIGCPKSDDATGDCTADKCSAGGDGSGTKTTHTYCTGELNCDEARGTTCSVGHNCSV